MPAPVLRPESIRRARLLSELDAASRRPLTVVRAPAGYGKTTAIAQWLEHAGIAQAWVTVDARGNDPAWFGARLVSALEHALPGRIAAAWRALEAGADLRQAVIPMVGRALADLRFAIVLDDYHVVSNAACHRVTRDLVDAMPAGVSVLVASRTAPPLGLSGRRAAGTLSEVGPEQLRFDREESERLFNESLGLELDDAQIELIDTRVKGWAVGLALIAAALTEHDDRTGVLSSLARSRAHLRAYLVEEVLDAARPELQRFLLRTSILDALSGPLSAAVVDDPRATELLDEVRRTRLFVGELEGEWLRYHPVFAETLVAELQRREPDLAPTLHRRASVWFEQADMPDQAIEHALAAGDAHRAAMLLAGSAKTLMAELRYTSIRRILDRLPPEERGSFGPFCEALDLQCMIAEGVDQRIVAERAEALAELHGGDPRVREFADVVLATPYHGDVRRALEVARARWQSLADKPDERQRIAPDYAFTLWWAGRHEEAREVTEPNLRVEQPLQFTVWTRAQLALCAADARNGDLAERYARDAMTIVEEAGAATAVEFTAVPAILAEALRVQGKLAEARRYLSPALEAEATRPGSVGHAFALVFDAQLALAEGNRRRAQTSARRARAIVDRLPDLGTIAARLRTVEAALEERPANPLLDTHPSPAEMRVLVLLDSDRTFAEIADELFVSAHTVTSHAQRLYRRLGVANRRDAVQAAHRRGFLPAGSGGDGGP